MKSLKNIIKEKLVINKINNKVVKKVDWSSADKILCLTFGIPEDTYFKEKYSLIFDLYHDLTGLEKRDKDKYKISANRSLVHKQFLGGWVTKLVKNLPYVSCERRLIYGDKEIYFFIPVYGPTLGSINFMLNYIKDNIRSYTVKEIFDDLLNMKLDADYMKEEYYLNIDNEFHVHRWRKQEIEKILDEINK